MPGEQVTVKVGRDGHSLTMDRDEVVAACNKPSMEAQWAAQQSGNAVPPDQPSAWAGRGSGTAWPNPNDMTDSTNIDTAVLIDGTDVIATGSDNPDRPAIGNDHPPISTFKPTASKLRAILVALDDQQRDDLLLNLGDYFDFDPATLSGSPSAQATALIKLCRQQNVMGKLITCLDDSALLPDHASAWQTWAVTQDQPAPPATPEPDPTVDDAATPTTPRRAPAGKMVTISDYDLVHLHRLMVQFSTDMVQLLCSYLAATLDNPNFKYESLAGDTPMIKTLKLLETCKGRCQISLLLDMVIAAEDTAGWAADTTLLRPDRAGWRQWAVVEDNGCG